MLPKPQLDDQAVWKQRFRAPVVLGTQFARANPARGGAVSNATDTFQLYAWDVPSGALRQLTDHPTGLAIGALSGDGRHIYYLDDQQGNELGHLVRIPFENGLPQDLTPDLPPYSCWAFFSNGSGSHLGFTTADHEGFHAYSLETSANGDIGARRRLFHSRKPGARSAGCGVRRSANSRFPERMDGRRPGDGTWAHDGWDQATGSRTVGSVGGSRVHRHRDRLYRGDRGGPR